MKITSVLTIKMGHPSCSKDHTICLQKDLLCTSLITLCKKGWMYGTRTNLWQATLKDYILALSNSYINMPLGKSHTKDFVTNTGHSLLRHLTFNSYSKDRACSVPSSNQTFFSTLGFRRLVTTAEFTSRESYHLFSYCEKKLFILTEGTTVLWCFP